MELIGHRILLHNALMYFLGCFPFCEFTMGMGDSLLPPQKQRKWVSVLIYNYIHFILQQLPAFILSQEFQMPATSARAVDKNL
jgi:hypothetical protein